MSLFATKKLKKPKSKMGFEEITIGKIKSPDIFYFVPVDENYEVYNRQVREMNEFFNLKEGLENSVRICSISFHRHYGFTKTTRSWSDLRRRTRMLV